MKTFLELIIYASPVDVHKVTWKKEFLLAGVVLPAQEKAKEEPSPSPKTKAASAISQAFKPSHFTASVMIFNTEMSVVVTAANGIPKKDVAIALLQKQVETLDLGNIYRINLYGKKEGAWFWAWKHYIKLDKSANLQPLTEENILGDKAETPTQTEQAPTKAQPKNVITAVGLGFVLLMVIGQCAKSPSVTSPSVTSLRATSSACKEARADYAREEQRVRDKGTVERSDIDSLYLYGYVKENACR